MIKLLHILIILSAFVPKTQEDRFLSPERLIIDDQSGQCFISLTTSAEVAVFDTKKEKLISRIGLPVDPAGLELDKKKKILFVTGGKEHGRVLGIDLKTQKITFKVPVGHTPGDLCLAGERDLLIVTNRFSNDISIISIKEQNEIRRIAIEREPVAIAISPDEQMVAVANYLPGSASNISHASARVNLINLSNPGSIETVILPNGSVGLRDLCYSPDGSFLYVIHNLSRFYVPATQVGKGWLNNSALSVIGTADGQYITTVLLDDMDRGASGACGIGISDDNREIYISISGTHELCVIDRVEMHNKIDAADEEEFERIPYSLSFLHNSKRRIPLYGKSPRFIGVHDGKVYVPTYFSNGMNVINTGDRLTTRFISLGKDPALTPERLGEQHFQDASIGYQGWQSCATCHLGQGHVDGLNWDLPGDGFGNPKNTKSLLASHQTPPMNHTGNVPDLATAIRSGIRGSIFVNLPESYAIELEAYLTSMKPIVSPFLQDGKLNESARRGAELFKQTGCSECHSGKYFTDLKEYDVGTGTAAYPEAKFDTPTLLEIWRSGPYLHDGRATILEDLFTRHNQDDKHGKTSELSQKEIEDLSEYLRSL